MKITDAALADREAIRDVAIRYCRGLDLDDPAIVQSTYWEDATDDHGKLFQGSGWEFAEWTASHRDRVRPTLHCVFNHLITLGHSGADATGEVYNVSFEFRAAAGLDARVHVITGRYLDRYEKRSGEWRIIHRKYDYVGEGRMSPPPWLASPASAMEGEPSGPDDA